MSGCNKFRVASKLYFPSCLDKNLSNLFLKVVTEAADFLFFFPKVSNLALHLNNVVVTKTFFAHLSFSFSLIRLEFNSTVVEYYTELDAVKLIGSQSPPPTVFMDENASTNVDSGLVENNQVGYN